MSTMRERERKTLFAPDRLCAVLHDDGFKREKERERERLMYWKVTLDELIGGGVGTSARTCA